MGGQSKITTVQALRALAALLIVIRHTGFYGYPFASGVDLFFVISGFVMVVSCWSDFGKQSATQHFAFRRLVRIVPLYWLATFLMVVGIYYLKNEFPWEPVTVFKSLFFYPFASGDPVLPPGWTLNYEMLFYAIFAFALVMPARPAVIAVSTTLAILVILGWILGPVNHFNVAFPLSLEFILGMAIGVAYCEGIRIPKSLGAVTSVFGFFVVGLSLKLALVSGQNDPMRVLGWGVPAAFVVAGATLAQWNWRSWINRPATLLGDSSYALYMFHQPIILILASLGYGRSSWPFIVTICIAASLSIHFMIERPIAACFRSKPLSDSGRTRAHQQALLVR